MKSGNQIESACHSVLDVGSPAELVLFLSEK